jgi:hypothetical protein
LLTQEVDMSKSPGPPPKRDSQRRRNKPASYGEAEPEVADVPAAPAPRELAIDNPHQLIVDIHEILAAPHPAEQVDGVEASRPQWFAAFLADRSTRKPWAHTLKAYRQNFDAIATLLVGGEDLSGMAVGAITIDTMRTAFARYAASHEAASMWCRFLEVGGQPNRE